MKKKVGKWDCDVKETEYGYVVSFFDEVPHQLLLKSLDNLEEQIKRYLYGYDEEGVHVPGYFDLVKAKKR